MPDPQFYIIRDAINPSTPSITIEADDITVNEGRVTFKKADIIQASFININYYIKPADEEQP